MEVRPFEDKQEKQPMHLQTRAEYKNLFPNFDSSLQVEEHFRSNTSIIPALSFGDRESNALSGIADNMSAVKLSDDKQNVDANMMHDAEVVCEDLTQLHEAGNLTESNQKQANEMDHKSFGDCSDCY